MTNIKNKINTIVLSYNNNFKFIKLVYSKKLLNICFILKQENFIKNFLVYNSTINFKSFIIIEFYKFKITSKLCKIQIFNENLKSTNKSFKELVVLKKKVPGIFIINTSKGMQSLSNAVINGYGGSLFCKFIYV